MHEFNSTQKDTSCFNNFQGGSSQAYAITEDNARFWLATASNSGGYTFVECRDSSPSVLTSCNGQLPLTCSSPVSSDYTPTNIPSTPTIGEDKSLSLSGNGKFVLGLPDLNEVYTSSSSGLQAKHIQKTTDPQQQFGRCVAITTSGNLLAVGAPMMNAGTGWVYIYEEDTTTTNQWTELYPLIPARTEVNEFGKKISFSDDDKILAVVSNEMLFIYQKAALGATFVELTYEALFFKSGTSGISNFNGGVAVIEDKVDHSLYTVYGKDDGDNVGALDVSFFEVFKAHPYSPTQCC